MKKAVFLLLSVFLLITSYCYGQKTPDITVKVDPRFEAISIFFTLSTMDTLDVKPAPSVYFKKVKAHYKYFEDHPSVKWYRDLESWDGYEISSLGFFLSEQPPFVVEKKTVNNYVRSTNQQLFLEKLNAFTIDFKTMYFVKGQQPLYSKVCKDVKDSILKSKIINYTEQFYGNNRLKKFVVVLDMLNNHGSNVIPLPFPQFSDQCVIRLGYHKAKNVVLTDDSPVNYPSHQNVIAHEISHIYMNEFIPAYRERLSKIKNLFLIPVGGKKLADENWENECDELLVRTCTAQILADKFGAAYGRKEIENQAKHYKAALPLYQFFEKYTANRKKYKTINMFYPELIAYLEELNNNANP
jgi:hypothetical protein